MLSSVGRVLTHAALFPVSTLGMTFGTSNCSKHSIVKRSKESEVFVASNMAMLKNNVSRASGEYLSSYLGSFGCSTASYKSAARLMQQNYGALFTKLATPASIVEQTQKILNGSQVTASDCHYTT